MHSPINIHTRGVLLALTGVLILTPDTLMMRWVELETWALVAYRGLMLGMGLMTIFFLTHRHFTLQDFKNLKSWTGASVVIAFGSNSITFTLGVAESSVSIVLTALATAPLLAALISIPILKEQTSPSTWMAILLCLGGVAIVVTDGGNAQGIPEGSPVLGGLFGLGTALGLAYTFVIIRLRPEINMIPAAALGSITGGLIGVLMAPDLSVTLENVPWLLLMGFMILPVSFFLITRAPIYVPAATVSLIMLLEAVLGPLWVWMGTGERPTPLMMAGTLLVITTLAIYLHTSFRNGIPG